MKKKKKAIHKHVKHDTTHKISVHICRHQPAHTSLNSVRAGSVSTPVSALVPVAELRPDKQGTERGRKMEPHPRSPTEVPAVMG